MNTIWTKPIESLQSIAYLGRYDETVPKGSLRWPLSGIEFSLRCTSLSVEIEATLTDHAPWLCAFVDGALFARFPLSEGTHWYPLLRGMDSSISHRISICNETQPIEQTSMGMRMLSLQSDGILSAPESPTYYFEFLGDSLTTGEGCVGPTSAQEWKTIWMSPSNGFIPRICHEMNARASVLSMSGWGVYSNWENDDRCNIPRIYDDLCGVCAEGTVPYHFSRAMDAVIINLGTNDISALKALPESEHNSRAETLKQAVASFIAHIRKRNPKAYLLWVYGMCSLEWISCFEEGVETAKANGIQNIGFLPLSPCTQAELGSRSHPGPQNHQIAAQAICNHLKAILK